ncbi:MAG TPA: twin-arginine translocase TatA/TatE family subunit [Phycisphaerales bacterium]|nr:twin-arginine translocase TatA/TatE family subunit [Phycisphaerales bacterium]
MFNLPGGIEWLIILAIGLLLFGRRLPDIGRSLGRTIVEFKKGVKGIEDEVDSASSESAVRATQPKTALPADAGVAERRVSTSDRVEQA